MSVGAVATMVLLLAVFSGLYIIEGKMMNKYQEKTNEQISTDEYYSENRKTAMVNSFDVWYAFPVAVLLLAIIYVILESIKDRTSDV